MRQIVTYLCQCFCNTHQSNAGGIDQMEEIEVEDLADEQVVDRKLWYLGIHLQLLSKNICTLQEDSSSLSLTKLCFTAICRMKGILIGWLIKVQFNFGLMDETLNLLVYLIDRFLVLKPVVRVGSCCAGSHSGLKVHA